VQTEENENIIELLFTVKRNPGWRRASRGCDCKNCKIMRRNPDLFEFIPGSDFLKIKLTEKGEELFLREKAMQALQH